MVLLALSVYINDIVNLVTLFNDFVRAFPLTSQGLVQGLTKRPVCETLLPLHCLWVVQGSAKRRGLGCVNSLPGSANSHTFLPISVLLAKQPRMADL